MQPHPMARVLASLVITAVAGASSAGAQAQRTVCDVGLSGTPVHLVAGDFNRDGNPDLAVVNQAGSQVFILLTDAQAFRALSCPGALMRTDVGVGSAPISIAAGDIDANLTVDLVVATADGISILRANAAGTFTAQAPIAGGADPRAVAITDINGDARADIVVGNGAGNAVTILLGAAQNEFAIANAIVLPTGAPISFLVVRDLDLDGQPDIVAGSTLTGELLVFLNDPQRTGHFRLVETVAAGTAPAAVAAADLTRDGAPDLAVVGGGINGTLRIFRNRLLSGQPTGFVLSDTKTGVGARPASIAAGNVDEDFDPDLVVANQDDDTVSFFFGRGDGTVQVAAGNCNIGGVLCEVGAAPRAVVLADVDADGRPDVVTANQGDGRVQGSLSFLLSSAPSTPTATFTRTPVPPTRTPTPTPTATITFTPSPVPSPTPTTSNCFTPRAAPGCDNPGCMACVCQGQNGDPFCCQADGGVWDLPCVQDALTRCAAQCGLPPTATVTSTPSVTFTPSRTASPTFTPTDTATPGPRTRSPTPTITLTHTATPPGDTHTPTLTPTVTLTPTISRTPSTTPTQTRTPTPRPTSTPRCVGQGQSQICTSGSTCAVVPGGASPAGALLVLLPGAVALLLRRYR